MFRIAKIGVIPSIFIDLKNDVPLCVSYMFGTARRRKWRKKWKKLGSIRQETVNNPGAAVPVDQLQSSQPGLVPQFLGKITSTRIWAAQVMVDRFSYLTYVQLMIITIQEDIVAGKIAIEIWDATSGVKINRYHADNIIFSEQHFI